MELWDIYDKNRVFTGRTKVRGEKLEEGEKHIVVHVCIFNSCGEMLIQQRQPFKEGFSNLWDVSVGGSAVAGDSSQEAAKREVFEELGLTYDFSTISPSITVNFDTGFDDYYLIQLDVDLSTLKLQYEEVQAVQYASLEHIIQLIDEMKFIPYHKSLIQLLFDMRGNMGAHILR